LLALIISQLADSLENIIKGCIAGKSLSKEMLYRMYANKMWGVCLRYAKDKDEAKDILQDGFIKVFDKISQFEGRGHFEGWLRKIMINTALAEYRKKRYLNFESDLSKDIDDGSEHIECDIAVEELLDIIKELPSQYKLVFNLYAIEGYSHKEISKMLGISEGTSKSNLSRARDILKKKVTAIYKTGIKLG
jgi:RNA polymerase sigma factor (sigma-70 family)